MKGNDVDQRTREWTKRSARADRYNLLERLSDRWCATKDAKTGIPPVPPVDGTEAVDPETLGTPRMMFLGQYGLGQLEREWLAYQAEVAGPMQRIRQATAGQQAARDALSAAKERVKQIDEAGVVGLDDRVAGETDTPDKVVRQRRTRERAAIREREAASVASASAELDRLSAEIAQLEAVVAIRLEIARRRAAMIEAHIRRRCAAYLTRLVRKHPQGSRLNKLLQPRWPQPPEWAGAGVGPIKPATGEPTSAPAVS